MLSFFQQDNVKPHSAHQTKPQLRKKKGADIRLACLHSCCTSQDVFAGKMGQNKKLNASLACYPQFQNTLLGTVRKNDCFAGVVNDLLSQQFSECAACLKCKNGFILTKIHTDVDTQTKKIQFLSLDFAWILSPVKVSSV